MGKKKVKQAIVIFVSLFLCAVLAFGVAFGIFSSVFGASSVNAFAEEKDNDKVLYLSDVSRIQHATGKAQDGKTAMSTAYNNKIYMKPSYTGTDLPGGAIQAKIENAWYTFENGIYVHGAGYVAFNISEFSNKYEYFSVYVGLLPAASKSDGSWVYVQTSEDGTDTKKWVTQEGDPNAETVGVKQKIAYNQNFLHITLNVKGVKWIRLCADVNNTDNKGNVIKGSNAQDYIAWADAKLSTSLEEGEAVKSLGAFDAQIKTKMANVDLDRIKDDKNADPFKDNKELELLVLQREFVSRVGQYALKKFLSESNDNKLMFDWLFNDLDSLDNLREFMLGGAPFKGNYYNSLTVLSNLYKNYKNDLSDTTLLSRDGKPATGNKFMPERTFGELCRTMMFSVALTHDGAIGSYLQGSKPENASEPLRRYAIFKYMYRTERFVATRNADGSWKSETMNMFGSLRVEEMRWLMCAIIDDESLIWLNDYVQTRINNAPGSVGNLYTPHSYVRYTDPNYGNPVFYAEANKDYFNALFSVDSREVKVGDKVIISDDNHGKALPEDQIAGSAHKNTNITHYGLWDAEYHVPAGEGKDDYVMKVTRSGEGEAHIQKVWMNFNNKFKTGSVCGGISKSGVNIRTSRGIPANVIGQPGHAAILYYSQDANGNGSWKIDNDVGGWLAATKGERHLLGWGNETWQRNSGGTVVYFHLSQTCLNDYDNLVRAEEYVWLAKVYQGDLDKQEAIYEKALTTQILNLDAWYGLVTAYKANATKTADDFSSLAGRIADTLWNHPTPMHCLLKLFTVETKIAEVDAVLTSPVFTTQLKTIEINALEKARASGSAAAKSKVNYLLGLSDTSVADFSFDGENAGCIVWADSYKGSGFRWRYSLDGKQTWSEEIVFTGEEESPVYQLPENQINAISTDNDIYVYIVGANPNNAYKIDVAAKPALPDTLYANDWENRVVGVDATYEWRYCDATATDTEVTYTPISNWRCFKDASPDCTGEKAIEVRLKGTAKKPASESKVFTFTADKDTEEKKYISIDYLTLVGFSTESQDAKRPNYAVNAIDGNANTYWHTDYAVSIKATVADKDGNPKKYEPAYITVKLDVPRYISCLEFSQRQYNSSFSIFAKKVTVYVSNDGENWTKAAERKGLENIADLNVVNFNASTYCQYIKLEMTELWETNKNDGIFTTLSLLNLYEDTTKKESPSGEKMESLSDVKPSKDSQEGFGAIVTKEEVEGEELVKDKPFEGIHPDDTSGATLDTTIDEILNNDSDDTDNTTAIVAVVLTLVGVALIGGGVAAFFVIRHRRNSDY